MTPNHLHRRLIPIVLMLSLLPAVASAQMGIPPVFQLADPASPQQFSELERWQLKYDAALLRRSSAKTGTIFGWIVMGAGVGVLVGQPCITFGLGCGRDRFVPGTALALTGGIIGMFQLKEFTRAAADVSRLAVQKPSGRLAVTFGPSWVRLRW